MDIDNWNAQLRKGVLDFCILLLLEERPGYGYNIIQTLAEFAGLDIRRGTIYALFKRLNEEGLIAYAWEESGAGPPRKIYSLTPAGRKALREMRIHWETFADSIARILRGGRNE